MRKVFDALIFQDRELRRLEKDILDFGNLLDAPAKAAAFLSTNVYWQRILQALLRMP